MRLDMSRSLAAVSMVSFLVFLVVLVTVPASAASWEEPPPGYSYEELATPTLGAAPTRWNQRTWTMRPHRVMPGVDEDGRFFGRSLPFITMGEPYIDYAEDDLVVDFIIARPQAMEYMHSSSSPWQTDMRRVNVTVGGPRWTVTCYNGLSRPVIPRNTYSTTGFSAGPLYNFRNSPPQFVSARFSNTGILAACGHGSAGPGGEPIDGWETIESITFEPLVTQTANNPELDMSVFDQSFRFRWYVGNSWKSSGSAISQSSCGMWFDLSAGWNPWDTVNIGGVDYTAEDLGCTLSEEYEDWSQSFDYLCRGAPTLAWGSFGEFGDWVGHYAKCLFVPPPDSVTAEAITFALSESALNADGTITQIGDSFTDANCGSLELPVVGATDSCEWTWAGPLRTVLSVVVWAGLGIFLLRRVLAHFGVRVLERVEE